MKRHSLLLLMLFGLTTTVMATEPDWQNYDQLLSKYVSSGKINSITLNVVNYSALIKDPGFKKAINTIATYDLAKLSGQQEKMAFYINAYNILALKTIADHWPIKSIKDAGSFFSPVWKKTAGKIADNAVSLHHVEHEILRKMGDPRIHMAIVCASVSCPDLRAEAYNAAKLNHQLDDQSTLFLNNQDKGLIIKGNKVLVSKIFSWFEDDFAKQGGIKGYINQYHPLSSSNIDADIDYDWNLNGH